MRSIPGLPHLHDLRRGWRFNNPNLEQLGLMQIEYQDIEDLAADEQEWRKPLRSCEQPGLPSAPMYCACCSASCVKACAWPRATWTAASSTSCARSASPIFASPGASPKTRRPVPSKWFVTSRPKDDNNAASSARSWKTIWSSAPAVHDWAGPAPTGSTWGGGSPYYKEIGTAPMQMSWALLKAAEATVWCARETDFGLTGWQLNGSAMLWKIGTGSSERQAHDNAFFRNLYRNIASLLRRARAPPVRLRGANIPPRWSRG